jgi:hypothetical protein
MGLGLQNKKIGSDYFGTAEKESRIARHENRSGALGTAENEFGSVKH